jgi:nitrite reductase/ring-hydroxylating ferredoxin subunit
MCVECGCETATAVKDAETTATAGRHRIEGFTAPAAGDLEQVLVRDRAIAVTVVNGEVYAFDDVCTHAQCSLSGGEIEGKEVVCPCHFGRFDIASGKVLGGPPEQPLRTYPARLSGGVLEIDVET